MNPPAKKLKPLWWFEPAWSFRPRLKLELAALLRPKPWLRILAVVVVVTLVLAAVLRKAIPDLEFDWTTALVKSIAACFAGLGLMIATLLLVPPVVCVSRRGVSRQQGQSAHWRLRPDIRRITVDASNSNRPLLRVETTGNPFVAGIARKVDPAQLVAFLKATFPDILIEERY